jgi:pimeloyl-ACP methyl ester carboxylesterase
MYGGLHIISTPMHHARASVAAIQCGYRVLHSEVEGLMKHHTVIGGGGTRLHLVEAGDPSGPSILFFHGCSQSWLTWDRQMRSELASRYRLIAMDLRGHGSSERPRDGYDDSRLWAADVDAAIRELELDRPILCGWSYGPLVILDYIRHYGEERIGGIHLVGAVTKLGSEAAAAAVSAEFLALLPALFSSDVGEAVGGIEALLRLCFGRKPEAWELYTMVGFGVSVPPFVRRALLTRVVDNDDLLPAIVKPVLITHGALDAVVGQEVVAQHRAGLPHARIDIVPDAGHAVFWDDTARFNRRLGAFREAVTKDSAS